MQVFAVSGYSFSGKTFLLEQIIGKLNKEGVSVATIKSTKEDIKAPEGTDTWRHDVAGANPTILFGPNTSTIRFSEKTNFIEVARCLKADYLLLEGFKKLDVPKFWCIGESSEETNGIPSSVKAIVIWEGMKYDGPSTDIPVYSNADIEKLVGIVKTEAISLEDIS